MLNINPQNQNFQNNTAFRAGRTCYFALEKARINVRKALNDIGYVKLLKERHKELENAALQGASQNVIDKIVRSIDSLSLKSESSVKIKRQKLADIMQNCLDYIGEVYGANSIQKADFEKFSKMFIDKLYGVNAGTINTVKKKRTPKSNLYIKTKEKTKTPIAKDKTVRKKVLQKKADNFFNLMNTFYGFLRN